MEYLYCSIIGYLIGNINPSYILGKIKGFDIRTKGSKNAGASNALILFGKVVGILCAIFDIAKAFLAILLTEALFPNFSYAFAITGVACILGHIFPFYMKFKGGKGLACLGGMILYFDWRVFLIFLAVEIIIALTTDYICFVPITASVIFPITYGFLTRNYAGMTVLLIMTAVMLAKHIENINRIMQGAEMRLSFLWKPEKEIERMKNNLNVKNDEINEHFLKSK